MGELGIISQGYTEIELGGVKRKLGKLTLGNWADLQAYKKEHYLKEAAERKKNVIETAQELYPDGVPDSVFDKVIKPPTEEDLESMDDVTVMTYLLWLALKRFDTSITLEGTGELITVDSVVAITAAITPQIEEKKTLKRRAKK
jgi:hypothetical protein